MFTTTDPAKAQEIGKILVVPFTFGGLCGCKHLRSVQQYLFLTCLGYIKKTFFALFIFPKTTVPKLKRHNLNC